MSYEPWTVTYFIVYDKYSGRQVLSRRFISVEAAEVGIRRWNELQFRLQKSEDPYVDPKDIRIIKIEETKTRIKRVKDVE